MSTHDAASSPNLYVAVLVMESSSDADDYAALYEESFVLIVADSDAQAAARAEQLGVDEQTSYVNDEGQTITWTLKHVVDVSRTLYDTLEDGATLYSRHFRDYDAYLRFESLLPGRGGL